MKRTDEKGFTLLELLIVITIIIVLAAAMMPLFRSSSLEAKMAKTRTDLDVIRAAALRFQYDTGVIVPKDLAVDEPRNVNDPYCLADNNYSCGPCDFYGHNCSGLKNWKGPYLTWVNDPWGHYYVICGNAYQWLAHGMGPNAIDEACTGDDICKMITQTP